MDIENALKREVLVTTRVRRVMSEYLDEFYIGIYARNNRRNGLISILSRRRVNDAVEIHQAALRR
jgi:hypothetical protein